MSDIDNRLFRYFVAVAEERHFAHAAERLGITPPTLTQQIQKLESQLGVKLLKRRGNTKVIVTAAGQRVLAAAREGLGTLERAAAIARQAGRGELGRLQLGYMASLSTAGLMPGWIDAFEQAHPAIDIMLRRMTPMAQINGIIRNELDAAFTRAPNKYPSGVRGFDIYRQHLALALPSTHPLVQHEAISLAMLAGEAFVNTAPEIDIGFFGYTEVIAAIGNFTPRVVKSDEDFMTVLAYVRHNHGIAVVPETVKTMNVPNVVFRDIATDPVPRISIAFVYGSDPSPPAKLLIRHMRRHALRNDGSSAAPPHHHERIIIPGALNPGPHPAVRAKQASKDEAEALRPRPSRLGAARRAPQGEEMSQR